MALSVGGADIWSTHSRPIFYFFALPHPVFAHSYSEGKIIKFQKCTTGSATPRTSGASAGPSTTGQRAGRNSSTVREKKRSFFFFLQLSLLIPCLGKKVLCAMSCLFLISQQLPQRESQYSNFPHFLRRMLCIHAAQLSPHPLIRKGFGSERRRASKREFQNRSISGF